jgi:catechol 2,3-dioxygenase-like lactoylglutathione lyase family enzyme
MKVTRILHASVNVSGGLDDAGRFYSEVLGLAPAARPPIPGVGGQWFTVADGQVHLVDAPMAGSGIDPTGPHFCLGVEDLDGAVAELAGRGIAVFRATQEIPGADGGPGRGVEQVWFTDPAGNTIELQLDQA